MEKMRQCALYMALISGLIDFMEGCDVDLDELKDLMGILKLDFDHLTNELHPFIAIQKICKQFGDLEITEKDIEEFMSSEEVVM